MSEHRREIDHLVVPVPDLDAAAEAAEAAGYVVTPRADHPFGTSNRLVVLSETYIELVAVTRPDLAAGNRFAAEVQRAVSDGTGINYVVLRTTDIERDMRTMEASGVTDITTLDFSRPAPRVDGTEIEAAFSLAFAPARQGGTDSFLCRHLTRQAIWYPPHLDHRNGATELCAVAVAGDPPPAGRHLSF